MNEQIREISGPFGAEHGTYDLFCECGSPDCTEHVELPPNAYAETRSDPALYLVVPGHERADSGRVVAGGLGYRIVSFSAGFSADGPSAASPMPPPPDAA